MKSIEDRPERSQSIQHLLSPPRRRCRILQVALVTALAITTAFPIQAASNDPDASLTVGSWDLESTSRSLPPAVNNAVNIGTFAFTVGAGSLKVTVNVASASYSVSKHYLLPMKWNQLPANTWFKVLPVVNTGAYSNNDFDLDVMSASPAQASLRLRTASSDGVHPGVADIVIESTGATSISFSNTIGAAAAPTGQFVGNVITQLGGNVGIATVPSADAVLDLNGGDTRGLRIRPRSAAGAPVAGTWNTGTIIMDSTATLYVCTAGGTPGVWKKVGAP